MKYTGFVGPAYSLKSVNVDCQKCINLYPEVIESGTGKESQMYYLKSTPGLRKILEVGTGPIRGISSDESGGIFVTSGNKLYLVTYASGTGLWSQTEVGTFETLAIDTITTSATVENVDFAGIDFTVFARGGGFNYYYAGGSFGTLESLGLSYNSVAFSTHVLFLDNYLIFIVPLENRFYVSNLSSLAVDALSFAGSEGSLDKIVSGIVNNRELWIFNERTTEVFANTGNPDFPFERISGGFIEKGCCATYSVAKIDGIIFWLGQDESGRGQVFAAPGLSLQRISTHAIEYAISTYADITTARAYTYQQDGHSFYVLNFAEATWVYDLSTKLWHERASYDGTNLIRHRTNTHCYMPSTNSHLVGDYASNKLYVLDKDYYQEDTSELIRLRRAPHISNSGNSIFYNSLQIDMETGIGNESGAGSDPQVILRYSNDGGHTWTSESSTSAGKKIGGVGEYKKRVKWNRLGKARDRVFEVKISDPVPVTIISAELDLEVGKN